MNNNEITIIKANVQAQLDGASVAPICIAGQPGTAKSTTIELISKELGMNLVTCSGPVLSHESLSGLPDTVEASKYQKNSIDGSVPKATQWSIPEIMAQTIRAAEDKPTILLIDDFHMVSPHLQSYFYGLLLERRLGNYKLSDNTSIVLTMNDSEAAGFNGINSAVRNRMSILQVEFNFDYWMDSFGNRLHYMVSSFLKTKSHFCMEPETTGITGYATARAWTAISSDLSYYTDDFILSQAKTISGMQVSVNASNAFQQHVNYISAIDFSVVVSSRELTNLADKDPLDSIIYSYITNFIRTVDDGLYLFDLMNKNIQESSFIGFVLGELYVKYTNKDEAPLSDGLTFVIDRLLAMSLDHSKYDNTSKDKLEKAFVTNIPNLDDMMKKAAEYLL